MRTLRDVRAEIDTLMNTNTKELKKAQISRVKNRLQFLRMIEKYLLSEPTEEFITKEISRIENRITALLDLFDPRGIKEPKKALHNFEKQNNIPFLRDQLRTLRFIKN